MKLSLLIHTYFLDLIVYFYFITAAAKINILPRKCIRCIAIFKNKENN